MDIFISYSRADTAFVNPLIQILRLKGYTCFRDVDHVKGGKSITSQITENLLNSKLLLLILSKTSLESRWVESEWNIAYQNNLPVLSLQIAPSTGKNKLKIPAFLSNDNILDFSAFRRRDFPYEAKINELIASLESLIGEPQPKHNPLLQEMNNKLQQILDTVSHETGSLEEEPAMQRILQIIKQLLEDYNARGLYLGISDLVNAMHNQGLIQPAQYEALNLLITYNEQWIHTPNLP